MANSAKIKEKRYYDSWRKEKTYSPALKSNIKVTLKGWRHITGATGHKKRLFSDVYRRLKLLPYAKVVIKKSTTIQNIVVKNKRKYYAIEAVVNISEKDSKKLRKVRVIIEEDQKGNYIFLSVMDKKS